MPNVGEEIAGEWLKHKKKCDFVLYNLYTENIQGEIDVFGVNLAEKTVYVCEVAVHLDGLQYNKNGKSDNVNRFNSKFTKGIVYAKKYFADYKINCMLWSPIVWKSSETSKNCQNRDVEEVKRYIESNENCQLDLIINDTFLKCILELRELARNTTQDIKSPILRFMQIEETLKMKSEDKRRKRVGKATK